MSHARTTIGWPGIPATTQFSFVFGGGVGPSTCTITCPVVGSDPEPTGTLKITYSSGQDTVELEFPECVLEAPPYQSGASGSFIRMPIKDRRIYWQFGQISGAYNQAEPDGKLVREKTPRELAELLLDEMGEVNYDVSRLPNDTRPAVKWNYTNPATELDSLCRDLGCVVILNPLTNRVELWPEGKGPEPDASIPAIGRSVGFSLLAKPEALLLVGEPTLFQGAFYSSQPVGEEVDGTTKPIDELSYTPNGGWGSVYPDFAGITGTYERDGETLEVRDLARSCVWRWYKLEYQINPQFEWSPELLKNTPLEAQEYSDLDLLGSLATSTKQADGTVSRRPAECFVKAWLGGDLAENQENFGKYKGSHSLDAKAGIVKFSEPVFQFTNGQFRHAEVVYKTAYHAGREGKRHAYTREKKLPGGKQGSGPKVLRQPLQLEYVDVVTSTGRRVRIQENSAELDKEADAFLDQLEDKYELQDAPTASYPGIIEGSPNGRVTQITWAKTASGTVTTISAGSRHNPYVKSIEEIRRLNEQQAQAAFLAGQQQADAAQLQRVEQ